jgi:hypothetical protein
MKYFVFVVTTAKPLPQDEGLNFRITFLAKNKAQAMRRFQRYFSGLILIRVS